MCESDLADEIFANEAVDTTERNKNNEYVIEFGLIEELLNNEEELANFFEFERGK